MTGKELWGSILQKAMEGKLVPQRKEEGTAAELLKEIRKERAKLVKEGKLKKAKPLPAVREEEKPFDIPDSWEWVRLRDIGIIIGGGTPKTGNLEYWDGDIPWITPADMKNIKGKYASHGNRNITKLGLEKSSARLLPKGTVLFSSRAPIGYIAIAANPICTNQGFKSVVLLNKNIADYLYYCLQSFTKDIENRASGTTFKEISGAEFGKTIIPLPPLSEQHRIVDKLENLKPLVDAYGQAAEELDELNRKFPGDLKKSLLQQAMEGKLVSQKKEEGTAAELLKEIRKEKAKLVKEGKLKKTKPLLAVREEEKPFDIPDSWEWVRLGEVCNVARGGSPRPIKSFLTENIEGINWIKIGDTDKTGKYINSTAQKIIKEGVVKSRFVHKGDLLLTNSMSFGHPYILNINGCIHDGWLVLFDYESTYYRDFLYYLLCTPFIRFQFVVKAAGAVVKNLNSDKVSQTIVPLPPLAEQHRIVEKLESLLVLCDKL
ncbi:restriction endonuclease subunit S [uncultured Dialister sp.]|uniref:restriction endonuclease subunit S n=1 Tax=uncultured Dialister sp. TaxID=278064 RepID=UPI00262F1164|nr:restriction endonuclease subunit S [uncultured Dialister sp.]